MTEMTDRTILTKLEDIYGTFRESWSGYKSTRKACPICGEEGTWRPVGLPCPSCGRRLLYLARDGHAKRLQDMQEDWRLVRMRYADSTPVEGINGDLSFLRDLIETMLLEKYSGTRFYGGAVSSIKARISEFLATQIAKVHVVLENIVSTAYKQGYNDGSNMLLRAARGDASVREVFSAGATNMDEKK